MYRGTLHTWLKEKTSFWSEQQDGERRWKQTREFGLESQTETPALIKNFCFHEKKWEPTDN